MILKRKTLFALAAFVMAACMPLAAQNDQEEEDEKKMIREVVEGIQVERPVVPVKPVTDTHDKKGKKKKHHETPPEETPVDTGGGMMPAPPAELKKRATAWMNKKVKEYVKKDATESGNTVECLVEYIYKPKELNPLAPVEGKITMKVIVDCKDGKYRYTIKDIKHVANNTNVSGGDVYADVPACGSMALPDPQWKRIKSFALQKGTETAAQLKEWMKKPVKEKKDEW